MKTYVGIADGPGCEWDVRVKEEGKRTRALPWKLNLVSHSPTGLAWGYGGSGPAQLALALLFDVTRNKKLAIDAHMDFKWAVVAKLPKDEGFEMPEEAIRKWVNAWRGWSASK